MKKIFTTLSIILLSVGMYAATEQAWYNDVTSIAANGQYYIYSVNGNGFMQAGQAKVQAITASNYTNISTYKFKISKADEGYVTNGSYYLKSYMEIGGSGSNSGPICTKSSDNGTKIIWTSMNSGEYWNIHGSYNAWFADRYPALKYEDGAYEGYISGSGVNYSKTKDTQTETKFRWLLVSQAQMDRHWAIYFWDKYKEEHPISQYNGLVPAAYYAAMETEYNKTYSVQDATVTVAQIEAGKDALAALLADVEAIKVAYADAKGVIDALDGVQDKGEDFAKVTSDIAAARQAIEDAMTVAALNTAVAAPALKQIDPITFTVTTFMAKQPLGTPACTPAGRVITYEAKDKNIINADAQPIYKGATKLTATAAETDTYYKFVRTADVTVDAPATTADENKTITYGDQETWNGYDLSTYMVGSHTLTYETLNDMGGKHTITLALTVNKIATLNVDVPLEFCEGGQVEYRGKIYTEAGTDAVSAEGATRDTLYNITITVNQPSYEEQTVQVKVGQSILFEEDGWFLRGETPVGAAYSTVKADTLDLWFVRYSTTEKGCDAVQKRIVEVELLDPYELEKDLEFCDGESAEYRGVTYTEAGTFTVEAEGLVRDTMITVNVTVYEHDTINLYALQAAGDEFELPEGAWTLNGEPVSGLIVTSEDDVPGLDFILVSTTDEGCEQVTVYHVEITSREGIEDVRAAQKVEKFFRNGVLYIRRGGRLFTAEGREVK